MQRVAQSGAEALAKSIARSAARPAAPVQRSSLGSICIDQRSRLPTSFSVTVIASVAVDGDVTEELQAEARREILALRLAAALPNTTAGPNVLSSGTGPRCRHGAGRRRIPRTDRNPETPRGWDRSDARRCSACRR